jgi:hypothetical protein
MFTWLYLYAIIQLNNKNSPVHKGGPMDSKTTIETRIEDYILEELFKCRFTIKEAADITGLPTSRIQSIYFLVRKRGIKRYSVKEVHPNIQALIEALTKTAELTNSVTC